MKKEIGYIRDGCDVRARRMRRRRGGRRRRPHGTSKHRKQLSTNNST
jgi:hypothetical protein